MKIVIIGGHLTPALSVIDELSKKDTVVYFGRKHAIEGDKAYSLEYQTIKEKEILFEEIKSGRLQRSFTKHTIPSLMKIPFGFVQSLKKLRKHKPDVVVGFGGYVSLPVIVSAKLLKIPIIIHEQTLAAGAANIHLAKFADKVCISFDSSRKYFPKEKVVLTGNPIRKSIISPKKKFKIKFKDPILYITGGSLGSHFVNDLIKECLSALLDKFVVVHQVGAATEFNDYEKLLILKEGLNNGKRDKYFLSKFYSVDEVGGIMNSASLVVSRAGINSISELIRLKKPSLIIPLPVSQKNEQKNNAEFLRSVGLGKVVEQQGLTPEEFLFQVNSMMNEIERYKLHEDVDSFPENAAKKIVDIIYDFQENRN